MSGILLFSLPRAVGNLDIQPSDLKLKSGTLREFDFVFLIHIYNVAQLEGNCKQKLFTFDIYFLTLPSMATLS